MDKEKNVNCSEFESKEEIEHRFPSKNCPNCGNYIYEDGIMSCKYLQI